ncbi:MAG TPA: radical SAM protein [Bryobacteraceae bacterium]|nr:radical SAM protein [Bryobacteraceae bacterium]
MADILLTHSNHLYSDRKQVRKMQPYPPLQTLLAAALLRERGDSVALCDVTLEESPEDAFRVALDQHRPQLVAVIEDNFNFLTKMCLTRNRELSFRMAAAAREAGVPAIVNGSDASDRAPEYLEAGFDTVIVGEVERGLEVWDRLPGGVWRAGTPLTDLDALPDAAWDLVDMEPYRAAWQGAHEYFSLNLISSRGCPYRCNWCAKPVFGSNYHFRSPQRVAREMLRLKREFGAGHIWFADDIFALSPQWTRRFSEEVENLGAVVPFKMQSRCDLMTRDTVGALRRAGCAEVWMGAESGSQKILDAMDKGTRVEQIYEARENLRRHGIRAGFFLQFGYPGETWNEIEQTIRMVRDTAPDDVGISVSYPLPGTKFYDRVAQELGEKVNWRDSDDLSMMFRGAYSTEFYRELADAVHQEVRGGDPQWERVRELERVSANPTLLWTSC